MVCNHATVTGLSLILLSTIGDVDSFSPLCYGRHSYATVWGPSSAPSTTQLYLAKGKKGSDKSNGGSGFGKPPTLQTKKAKKTKRPSPRGSPSKARPYVKSEQNDLIEQLARQSSATPLGRVVQEADNIDDPFWQLLPSLIASKFPNVKNEQLERIADFVQYSFLQNTSPAQKPTDWIDHPHRPYKDLHAYMPGLGETQPFRDPSVFEFCQKLEDNYETILTEYQALVNSNYTDLFQSVTSMNYESGWKTLVLFYNGHRIEGFPYHLCPTTTTLLQENIPLAGRIAGFNRQQPGSGIPLHTDGNNLWLTCQMGLGNVPDGAYIQVAREKRYWKAGKTMVYDTTYEHETWNPDSAVERVVLHVDFFNTHALTSTEIEILQYLYQLREEFLKAEGVAKVGAQIL